jgi:hypothetical protein
MNCPRCDARMTLVSEYYDFEESLFFRDLYCSICKSGIFEKFQENGRYSSEWIDFNV